MLQKNKLRKSKNEKTCIFTVIMPVRNRAAIIGEAIESVLSQTYRNFELLIIDDGSEDNLVEVVRSYLRENIHYYKSPRQGLSAARNFGLQKAKGKYIAYLDSDNFWHHDFLEKMSKALHRPFFKADAAYCLCNRYQKDKGGKNFDFVSVGGRPFDYKSLTEENYIDLNTFIHSKKCVQKIGLFDESLKRLVDWDLILRVTSRYRPVFLPEALVDYYLGVCPNTVTLTEDVSAPFAAIRAKYGKRDIKIFHDEIWYDYKNVPENKFINWAKMSSQSRHDIYHRIEAKTLHPKESASFVSPGYPYILQIEPTSICNLACPLCPAGEKSLTRKQRHMTLNEFKSIIDDMNEYLLFLILWDWGEPLMNPAFPEMIRYAADRGIKTVTSTNAHFFMDADYTKRILQSGLSTLIVAIDSLRQENYQVYRKGGDLSKAIWGLEKLVEMKKKLRSKTLINLRMVVMRSNEQEIPAMRDYARKLKIDKFTLKTVNPSCGLKAMDDEVVPVNPKFRRYIYDPITDERIRINAICERVWFMSNIFSNGDVVPCCYDYDSEQKVGNAFQSPFSQIWNSSPYRELRKKIYLEKETIPKCAECGINYKLSETGWFVEALEFNPGIIQRAKNYLRQMKKLAV